MPKADLVLEGGGVKGLGLVGAVLHLMREGYTFPRVAGTSAGSIVAAFLAAGATADELAAHHGPPGLLAGARPRRPPGRRARASAWCGTAARTPGTTSTASCATSSSGSA